MNSLITVVILDISSRENALGSSASALVDDALALALLLGLTSKSSIPSIPVASRFWADGGGWSAIGIRG